MRIILLTLCIISVYSKCTNNEVRVQKNVTDDILINYVKTKYNETVDGFPFPLANGCSTNKFNSQIESHLFKFEHFTSCCDLHDTCYDICGIGQHYCDMTFLSCNKQICDTYYPDNEKCPLSAKQISVGVVLLGANFYIPAQDRICTCLNKDQKKQHYDGIFQFLNKTYDEYDTLEETLFRIYEKNTNLIKKIGKRKQINNVGNPVEKLKDSDRDSFYYGKTMYYYFSEAIIDITENIVNYFN